jgi:hypothetical protein
LLSNIVLIKFNLGSEYNADGKDTRNMPNTIMMEQKMISDGKNNLFTSGGSNFKPMPLKTKPKGSKLRKKSKYKDQKPIKDREFQPPPSASGKSKSFKKPTTSATSTPINGQEKISSIQPDSQIISNGKHSS